MQNTNTFVGFKEGDATYLFGTFSLYPFAIFMGILAAIFTITYFWKKNSYQWDILLTLIIITIPSSIIGARLLFIIERLMYNWDDPFPGSAWYAIWEGGLSIQGGVFLAAVLDLAYLSFKKEIIDRRNVFGIILPTVLIGQAIGRWGNFANHEVFGKVIDGDSLNWLGDAIKYNMLINGDFRVPLFFYESLVNLIGYIIIVWVIINLNLTKPGTPGALYLIWYGVTRVAMEPLREESYLFYTIIAVLSIILGLVLTVWFEWTGLAIYQKSKVGKYSFEYVNKIIKPTPINLHSRWINE